MRSEGASLFERRVCVYRKVNGEKLRRKLGRENAKNCMGKGM